MKSSTLAIAVMLGLLAGCSRQSRPEPLRPAAGIWHESGGRIAPVEEWRTLIVGVWSDGTVIWSDNRKVGGKPYHKAAINRATLSKLMSDLNAAGFFDESRRVNYGPDASFTTLAADDGIKRQRLGSWHDPAPENPLIVIDERGMSSLAPGEAKPKPSDAYAKFLSTWSQSRQLIESVIPKQGEPLSASPDERIYDLGRQR